MSMERRGFLTGLISSIAGASAMVKLATPAEARALEVAKPVVLRQPQPLEPISQNLIGGEVFMRAGRDYVPVGYVTRLDIDSAVDALPSISGEAVVIPNGLRTATLEFRGIWQSEHGPMAFFER